VRHSFAPCALSAGRIGNCPGTPALGGAKCGSDDHKWHR